MSLLDGMYTQFMSDWDAAGYHRVSDPQWSWGLRVLERLSPAARERILDLGCGTGRLACEILQRAPRVTVTALDRSWTMLAQATGSSNGIHFVQADATSLPFAAVFDAVFSTAAFHWVRDHDRLFAAIYGVLRPGGRLVSQAGGGPNLARLYERAAEVARRAEFARCFQPWSDRWTFAGVEATQARMQRAGFVDIEVWLEPAPTTFADARAFAEFTSTVCLRHHLDRLPPSDRAAYVSRITALAADDDPPFTLDYWRLNIDARR